MLPENTVEECNSGIKSKTINCSESDDGYSKSDENSSFNSAEVVLVECKSAASSSSGLESATSSCQLKDSPNEHSSEVVKKILVSNEVNEAIFKPDYRLSFKCSGEPKYWHDQNLRDIDFLTEHTKDSLVSDEENTTIISKSTMDRGKIYVRISLEKNNMPNDNPMIKVHIRNDRVRSPVTLFHLLWINLYEHKIVTMNSISQPNIKIPMSESTEIYVPVEKFDLSKYYKFIVYYGPMDLLFSKEFVLRVTTRPISTMYMEKLDHYFPEQTVRKLDRYNYKVPKEDEILYELKSLKREINTYMRSDTGSRLSSENYYSMCKLLLQMEDETDSKRSLRHDQHKKSVKHEFGNRYSLTINNERLEAAINEYTRIWITPMSVRQAELQSNGARSQQKRILQINGMNQPIRHCKKERIYGSVVEIKGNKAYLELNERLDRFVDRTKVSPHDEVYFIRFMNDRTTITLEHRALEYLNNQGIAHFFFPTANAMDTMSVNKTHPSSYSNQMITWTSDDVNDEQKSAVTNILKQTSYPYPYLLFGPPGTGKTKTLIEAILQIIRNDNPTEYILVCATSNSACNEVAKRLLINLGSDKVFRIFAKSAAFKMDEIPSEVLAASNLQKGEHYYPSLQVIYQFKVVVCTLTTAGRLSQGKINPKHFSHVFVDEAGSATETQILITVAGLCSSKNELHANLIFAGDPKQLGPLIKSQQAVKMGYGISMLERLITTNSLYMRNENTKNFNQNYVTQLVCNYRSHSSILYSSNNLYYDNVLRICAAKVNTDWFLGTNILKEPEFPMLFHSVKGTTERDKFSPSSYNRMEIDVTINYLRRIFQLTERKVAQCDIGIISPYRRQCELIAEACKLNKYHDIQIGSVEVFQGQEKPIIIVSTVRAQMDNIGFLDSKKRLNVLLTRAKCLLIIIGDSDTLAKDEDWSYVVEFCKANNSLIE